jgi:hypothetical protein
VARLAASDGKRVPSNDTPDGSNLLLSGIAALFNEKGTIHEGFQVYGGEPLSQTSVEVIVLTTS